MNIRITTVFVITGVVVPMLMFAAGPITATHQALALSNTGSANGGISGADGTSSGTRSFNSNDGFALGYSTGQIGAGGGSSGATIGGGSTGPSVDRHLFCITGMITPICK
jgi:hypothetical protein